MCPSCEEHPKYGEIPSFIKIRVWEVVQMLICNKKMCVRSIKMSARSSCAKAGQQIITIWSFHYTIILNHTIEYTLRVKVTDRKQIIL